MVRRINILNLTRFIAFGKSVTGRFRGLTNFFNSSFKLILFLILIYFLFLTLLTIRITGTHKTSLNRTLDVYDIQELCDDPDPHATLPFISHHTLNISRELDDKTTPSKFSRKLISVMLTIDITIGENLNSIKSIL